MVNKEIKDTMDSVEAADRWMHAYTYSAHPTCCAVALKNIGIIQRERLCEKASGRWEISSMPQLKAVSETTLVSAMSRAGELLARAVGFEEWELPRRIRHRPVRSARLQTELMNRGLVTRTLPFRGRPSGTRAMRAAFG